MAEAEEEKVRKAAIVQANNEKIEKLVRVASLHTSVGGGYDWERKNRFQIRIQNKGDREIMSFSGKLHMPSHGFDHAIRATSALPAGSTDNFLWEFDVNRFTPETVRAYAAGESDDVALEVDAITYADGSTVHRDSDVD